MKKKIVAVLACLALVFGMFGAEVKENKAESTASMFLGTTDNGNYVLNEDSFGSEYKEFLDELKTEFTDNEYKAYCDYMCIGKTVYDLDKKVVGAGLTPGMTYNVGDTIYATGNTDVDILFMKSCPSVPDNFSTYMDVQMFNEWIYGMMMTVETEDVKDYELIGTNFDFYEEGMPNSLVVPAMEGVTAWRVLYVLASIDASKYTPLYVSFVVLVPVQESSLVTSGNTTQWIDGTGRVLWTITEEADKIVANLTDCSAIKADYVKAWNESGKALSITYKYNGYTVAIDVPAGELTDTGAEWYGPEYLAAVNQKYVVVKDVYGIVVPNDRIYKK